MAAREDAAPLGWALIGASRMAGRYMAQALRGAREPISQISWTSSEQRPLGRLVGVYSAHFPRAEAFAFQHRVARAFKELDALLARPEVDCVYVSTFPRRQAEMVEAALTAGKHVLCEPPLALTVEEARGLAEAARRYGLILAVNFPARRHPALVQAAELVRDYAIGELLGGRIHNTVPLPLEQQSWRLHPDGGGVVYDRTTHDIDLVRWLFADELGQVAALATDNVWDGGVEDDLVVNLRLRRSELLIQCRDSFVLPHVLDAVEIYGATGSLVVHHWRSQPAGELLLVRNGRVEPLAFPEMDP
ncbi:MAG: gfo/Idh/MocA family oxidoreductase, partial [Caldilineae bacterium]